MTDDELDRLLAGSTGVSIRLNTGHRLHLDRQALKTPQALRAAVRRQFGHAGWDMPRYSQDDHDQLVRVLFHVVDMEADQRATPADCLGT